MSREPREGRSPAGAGLRLLGSPMQLASRDSVVVTCGGGGRRSRPRSAATRGTRTPDTNDRSRRPFSADTKTAGVHSIRNLLKGSDHTEFNLNEYLSEAITIVPPTAALLEHHSNDDSPKHKHHDIYSNASDHGSEDTYVSLGTKIKAKAQYGGKIANKNYLKYRDIARKESKEQNVDKSFSDNVFDFNVSIENRLNNSPNSSDDLEKKFESYFLPLGGKEETSPSADPLAGRVSFGKGNTHCEDDDIDYPRSPPLRFGKQQLSLVEEESYELESAPSQHLASLSPPTDKLNNGEEMKDGADTERGTHVLKFKEVKLTSRNNIEQSARVKNKLIDDLEDGARTYDSFYDDFTSQKNDKSDAKNAGLSSTIFSISRDYGLQYGNDRTPPLTHRNSLPEFSTNKHFDKNLHAKSDGEQHSSIECISLENGEGRKRAFTPRSSCQWNEPPRHSRLLCKEFLGEFTTVDKCNADKDIFNVQIENSNVEQTETEINIDEYPQYLNNSLNKVYTSKVIEDYKKELLAIDSLHELTLKDIKTDCVSPTPLNIDVMFEEIEDSRRVDVTKKYDVLAKIENKHFKNISAKNSDVVNISTKELIQNYFRVKEGEPKQSQTPTKVEKKRFLDKSLDVKSTNAGSASNTNQSWNKSHSFSHSRQTNGNNLPSPVKRNNTLGSRIECVQKDQDVDSWMSMASSSRNEVSHSPKISDGIASVNKKEISHQSVIGDNGSLAKEKSSASETEPAKDESGDASESLAKDMHDKSTVLDIYSMLKEIESYGDNPVVSAESSQIDKDKSEEENVPKDNFTEIFSFLEKVEHSANEALSVVTTSAPQLIPKLDTLLRLPQTELAQRYITAALQLEERSCCIALLQESLTNHKEQMVVKVNGLERQSCRNIAKVKQECEEAITRHQTFIDQLISDKKTLNHRIEQMVEERRALEERWKRSTQTLEQRYRLELKNQHDRMAAAQQVARQRWVRQKAEKIKELTVKGLEGELREMAERAAAESAQVRLSHAETVGRLQAQHAAELERVRAELRQEAEAGAARERQLAATRLERQIVELEATHAEQRTRLVAELRAESERAAADLSERERQSRVDIEKWRQEQEAEMESKMRRLDKEIALERESLEEQLRRKRDAVDEELEKYKRQLDAEQQKEMKRRLNEMSTAHKAERDREIERAIESMEAEAQKGRKELQEALRRNKEQYEAELRELGETEQATLRRYLEAQARVRATEDRCAELETQVNQLETRNRVLTEKTNQLEGSLEVARRDDEETRRAAVAAVKQEMENTRRTHEEQMQQLYAKVKVALSRKDSVIQALTREKDKAQEKITLLEQRLQQQRKDLLKHK